MNRISGIIRRCVDDYNMIEEGDRIAVGISGGKDSMLLLCGLAKLKEYYPKHFELEAVTLNMGFEGMDFSPVQALCDSLNVHYTLIESEFKHLIFDERQEKNPCSLCAKMRKGAINDVLKERNINKLALGHHFDDAVETYLMSLFYEGRIYCFQPVTYLDRSGVTQIRPMLYLHEDAVRRAAERFELPVVKNTCPMDGESSREEVKQLIKQLSGQYPDIKERIFGAMRRYPLEGWEPAQHRRLRNRESKLGL